MAHIIQARMEEIVVQFFYQIRKSGYVDKLGAGIVITGGTSLLPNMGQLVKFHTGFDVRVGKPTMHTFVSTKGVNDPRFATVLGLLKLASEEDKFNGKNGRWKMKRVKEKSNEPGMFTKVQKKFTQGLLNFFEEETADTEMT